MRFNHRVTVVGTGQYGPFDDGRVIQYAVIADGNGDPERATCAEGVDLEDAELFTPVTADLELYRGGNDSKLKLRLHGFV